MNGKDLIWKAHINGLTYRESEKENTVIIVSSYEKIGRRFKLIKEKFTNAVIKDIEDEFGYGLFEIQLQ